MISAITLILTYERCSESGFIISFNGMLGTSARYVLKALHSTFPMIPSITQRHYFLLSYSKSLNKCVYFQCESLESKIVVSAK